VIRTAASNGPATQPASQRWLADPRAPIVALLLSILVGVLAEACLARADATVDAILTDAASGFAFVLAGCVAWRRRPDNRVGPIMVGIGLAWFGGDFLFAPVPLVGHGAGAGATVRTGLVGAELLVEVADDGPGGAAPKAGSGLQGLDDRLAAIAGTLEIDSQPGQGTRLRARIPVAS
jgi:hypothetical protein